MAEAAKKPNANKNQQQAAVSAPIVVRPDQKAEDVCRGDAAALICDIASNPRRAGLATIVNSAALKFDNAKSGINIPDYNGVVTALKEEARKGWVADHLIGELAARGIPRIQFKEENGQITHDNNGQAIIKMDLASTLAAKIVSVVETTPDATQMNMGKGNLPLPIHKPRVCIAAFADINMRLRENTQTTGHPSAVTDEVTKEVVKLDRQALPDAALEAKVAGHLANRGNVSLDQVIQDCGMLGMRQLHDEGFRYQGQHMVTPPQTTGTPSQSSATGVIRK